MAGYETLSIEKRGQVDWLTLNRPDSLNAIDTPLVIELGDRFGGTAGRARPKKADHQRDGQNVGSSVNRHVSYRLARIPECDQRVASSHTDHSPCRELK